MMPRIIWFCAVVLVHLGSYYTLRYFGVPDIRASVTSIPIAILICLAAWLSVRWACGVLDDTR